MHIHEWNNIVWGKSAIKVGSFSRGNPFKIWKGTFLGLSNWVGGGWVKVGKVWAWARGLFYKLEVAGGVCWSRRCCRRRGISIRIINRVDKTVQLPEEGDRRFWLRRRRERRKARPSSLIPLWGGRVAKALMWSAAESSTALPLTTLLKMILTGMDSALVFASTADLANSVSTWAAKPLDSCV